MVQWENQPDSVLRTQKIANWHEIRQIKLVHLKLHRMLDSPHRISHFNIKMLYTNSQFSLFQGQKRLGFSASSWSGKGLFLAVADALWGDKYYPQGEAEKRSGTTFCHPGSLLWPDEPDACRSTLAFNLVSVRNDPVVSSHSDFKYPNMPSAIIPEGFSVDNPRKTPPLWTEDKSLWDRKVDEHLNKWSFIKICLLSRSAFLQE